MLSLLFPRCLLTAVSFALQVSGAAGSGFGAFWLQHSPAGDTEDVPTLFCASVSPAIKSVTHLCKPLYKLWV